MYNNPNIHIRTFCKRGSFIWRRFFPASILKDSILKDLGFTYSKNSSVTIATLLIMVKLKRPPQCSGREHLSLSALTGKRVINSKTSAVKDHCMF